MRNLAQILLHWTLRHLLTFVMIVAVLLAGNWLLGEIREYGLLTDETAALRADRLEAERQMRDLARGAADRVAQMRMAARDQLDARIAGVDAEIARQRAAQTSIGGVVLPTRASLSAGAAIKVLEFESEALKRLRSAADYERGMQELEKLKTAAGVAATELQVNQADQAALEKDVGIARLLPGTQAFNRWLVLKEAGATLKERADAAQGRYDEQKARMALLPKPQLPAVFELEQARIAAAFAPLDAALREREQRLLENWVRKASGPVFDVLPTALLVLLGVILTPLLIKAFFYYVIARLAERRPPIRVMETAPGTPVDAQLLVAGESRANISAVSLDITVDAEHELLVHPEYLQSSSTGGDKGTQWLLDWRYPLSSLLSGMFGLTRVRAAQSETVVVSALKNPLTELALLDLPAGAALVFQPRGLVGVLYRRGAPLRITRHWRLFSLQAWLTLQLRYLVFHGPAQLIVKGCRGVKVEAAGSGRRVNQAATLGFSAHLDYSTRRCETFFAYLTGAEELFNDSFTGAAGYFIYEEVPNEGRKGGLTGRGLEGLSDSLLKVLGI